MRKRERERETETERERENAQILEVSYVKHWSYLSLITGTCK